MNCPIETHQFIETWKLPSKLHHLYNDSWIHNNNSGYFGFIPKNPIALILGTFPIPEKKTSGFFYHSAANRFWTILSNISCTDTKLSTLENKLSWLSEKQIAISDILCKVQRTDKDCSSSADNDLNAICYNNILQLLHDHPTIKDIFLTSGGPTAKALSGKSAGGWLGSHLREAPTRPRLQLGYKTTAFVTPDNIRA